MNMCFTKEYTEKSFKDASILLGAIPLRYILLGRMF